MDKLAISGGNAVRSSAFPPWPSFSKDEINAVSGVLESGKVNYWTGDECRKFEQEYAKSVGTEFAVAVMNGTVALEGALMALDIGPGDEVVVTSRTFIASASVIVLRGAIPVFADIDLNSQNISADTIRAVLSPKTKAIIAVHLAGYPCDMDSIMALAREHDLKVIEDCAQAHGATYGNKQVGSIGDVAAFSFCQDKIITTGGEGGMITTNCKDIWERIWSYKDHGKSYDDVYNRPHPVGFRWLHESVGTNWRMTEMQATIGRIQLSNLSEWTSLRKRNAAILDEKLKRLPALRLTIVPSGSGHAFYKYYVFIRPEFLIEGWGRDRIMESINAEGVPCYSGSCSEVYLENVFEKLGVGPPDRLENARALGDTSLMFLVHPTLGDREMNETAIAIEKVISKASL